MGYDNVGFGHYSDFFCELFDLSNKFTHLYVLILFVTTVIFVKKNNLFQYNFHVY